MVGFLVWSLTEPNVVELEVVELEVVEPETVQPEVSELEIDQKPLIPRLPMVELEIKDKVEFEDSSDHLQENQVAEKQKETQLVGRLDTVVPFSSQAPQFKWTDPRQQDGCEEVSVLMAMAWVKGEKGILAVEWEKRITDLADFSQEKYGEHRDVSVQDTVAWLFKDYFSYDQVRIESIKNPAQIVAELESGNLVLVPLNGQALGNPNFTPPGPEHHFIVIKGYDYQTREFITHDPGTRLGANYRYPERVVYEALRAYPTGYHEDYADLRKEAIIVSR